MSTLKGNFGGPNNPPQQKQQIDITQTSPVKCESCGNSTFKQTLLLRKLSALVSPDGQETLVPVQVFACDKCGHVNKEFSEIGGIQ